MGKEERVPLKKRILIENERMKTKKMDPKYAIIYCLNYAMGSGFLTLPRAFVDAGIGLGCFLTIIIAIGATVSAECVLDVLARAERQSSLSSESSYGGTLPPVISEDEEEKSDARNIEKSVFSAPPLYQVSDLCALYLGNIGYVTYMIMLLCFMYGSLWAYAAIFGASFAAHALIPGIGYRFYVLLFGIIIAPLSCRDLAEQKFIQLALAIGRTLMLALMILTALTALVASGPLIQTSSSQFQQDFFHRILSAAPILAFACTLHHSIPQICAPIDTSKKIHNGISVLNLVFRCAFFFATVLYLLFASTIALFFGQDTKSAVNLDWDRYALNSPSTFVRATGTIIQRFIVLYPAVNVISTYPLVAVTLGDALFTMARKTILASVSCIEHPFGDRRLSPAAHFIKKTEQEERPPTLADLSYNDLITPDAENNSIAENQDDDENQRRDSSSSTGITCNTNIFGITTSNGDSNLTFPPSDASYTSSIRDKDNASLPMYRNLFRLVAAFPPIIGALLADDISDITRFTGVFGLGMCFAIPGLLALIARRHDASSVCSLPSTTVNSSILNSPPAAIILLLCGTLLALIPLLSAASTHLEQNHARTVSPHLTPHYPHHHRSHRHSSFFFSPP
mmetsp:Transcript_9039/g.13911  ORF Transcript_9039/g.13911 Transcript_9039/m.13911 type:complete len:625 (+) Transcript_9039:91-1965(+)